VVAAAVPMAEAAVVNAVTPPARVLAPQVTALAPLTALPGRPALTFAIRYEPRTWTTRDPRAR